MDTKNLEQFWQDIDDIIDDSKKSQFLGVIVTVPSTLSLGRPTTYDIVDGQQRLFTCYISIMAAVKVALDNNDLVWALEAARSYLLLRTFSGYPTNTKLVPSAADRHQFRIMWEEISLHKNLKEKNSWDNIGRPVPPSASGNFSGKLLSQYRRIISRYANYYKQKQSDKVKKILEIIAGKLSFVAISLRDPIAAPVIFERLNARGEKITTSDLVRNEIFARVASDPMRAQSIFDNDWEPFIKKFSEKEIDLEKLLFPYGLIIDENTTKADLFNLIRRKWIEIDDPREIISDLDRHSSALIALESGNIDDGIPSGLQLAVERFHAMRAPSSIYAFVCKVIEEVRGGAILESNANSVFEVIESFLVRRAICGYEPTGLHAVFKGLWREITSLSPDLNPNFVEKAIRNKRTIQWPSNEEFIEAIRHEDIYSRKICKYALIQYELDCHGESPEDDFWIEHILPKSKNLEWSKKFSDKQHEIYANTFANLIPLTSEMNSSEGQNSFLKKKSSYENSIFASARDVARKFTDWTPEFLQVRSNEIGIWASNRWPK